MKIGDPLDRSTDHGPQNHKAHLDKLVEYCDTGVKEGATLVCGGRQVERPGTKGLRSQIDHERSTTECSPTRGGSFESRKSDCLARHP